MSYDEIMSSKLRLLYASANPVRDSPNGRLLKVTTIYYLRQEGLVEAKVV